MSKALLIIDMQNDFVLPTGALSVAGAEDDAARVAAFIRKNGADIDAIVATMDSHHPIHIAHPAFWTDEKGNNPAPLTTITSADIAAGVWKAEIEPEWSAAYVAKIEALGKSHTIWNPHCLDGSVGAAIVAPVMDAMVEWEVSTGRQYQLVRKGGNMLTEHYSVFRAEVEVPGCAETALNTALLQSLSAFDTVYLCGECENICVLNSLENINRFAPELAGKLVILEDCMSPIGPFDINTDPVYQQAVALGAVIGKS